MIELQEKTLSRSLPFLDRLTENWEIVRDELDRVPEIELHKPSKDVRLLDTDRNKWCHYLIKLRGLWTPKGIKNFPRTIEILRDTPNLFRVAFLTMLPGTWIHPHVGDYKKAEQGYKRIWRYHLGIKMNENDNPYQAIVIGNEVRRWREGESFIFNDGEIHCAWNYGKEPRTILCVDLFI